MAVSKSRQLTDLDYPLIKFSESPSDFWTIRDAVRGVQIFGGIGSGKSSGSGKTIALSFLKSGFGGIILTGKSDEKDMWLEYAKMTGREKDIKIFGEGGKWKFNPLDYEMNRKSEGAGQTMNIVNIFTNIIQMGSRISGSGGGSGDDPFWEMALKRCITAMVDLLKLAGEEITIANMAKLLQEAPEGENYLYTYADFATTDDKEKQEEFEGWQESSFCIKCIAAADDRELSGMELRMFEVAISYFLKDFPTLAEKTRTSIVEYFLSFANPFRSGLLAEYLAQETTIYPEETHQGTIIILDFPVKKYLEVGIYAQSIFKLLWEQSTERRDVDKHPLPVFMWVDESQYFINEYDMLFQTTARSSKACTVFLTQNISNYYATIGGKHPKERVNSLLGNLSTKIFHANNDYVTNEWAANTIGKTFQSKTSVSVGKYDSTSISEALHYQIEPQEFTVLKSGAEENHFEVEAIITVTGKKWSNSKNFMKIFFNQKIGL